MSKHSNLRAESDALEAEVAKVAQGMMEQSRPTAFGYFLRHIPDEVLTRLVEGLVDPSDDNPTSAACMMGVLYLRSHLHGDRKGGFMATEGEIADMVNTFQPYLMLELIRRRRCFSDFEMPKTPWGAGAAVRVGKPDRVKIEATVAELASLGIHRPLLINNLELLDRMESEGHGAIAPMPIQGRTVIDVEVHQLKPQKLPPLNPETFKEALMAIANMDRGSYTTAPSPGFSDVDFIDKDRVVETFRLGTDDRVAHICDVFRKHFDGDPESAKNVTVRFFALSQLVEQDLLIEWVNQGPLGGLIHPAIFVAAATVKLTPTGEFPPAKFLNEVKQIADSGTYGTASDPQPRQRYLH